jgi:hypothetical protein
MKIYSQFKRYLWLVAMSFALAANGALTVTPGGGGSGGTGGVLTNNTVAAVIANFYTNSTPHWIDGEARLGTSTAGRIQCAVTNSDATLFFHYQNEVATITALSNTISFKVPPGGWWKFIGLTTTATDGQQQLLYVATNGSVSFATSAGNAATVTDGATQSGLAAGSYAQAHSVWLAKPSGLATNYSSLSAAKTAAASGDVITATALNVGATNLLKNGVDYDFTGVTLTHSNQIPQSAGLPLAPFDDRGQGAITNTVKGIKLIDFRSQVLQSGDAISDTNPFVNFNAFAPIYITNPAANIRIDVDTIKHSIVGNANTTAAIYVKDCTNTVFNVGQIIDPLWLSPNVYVGKDEFDDDVTLQSAGAGVYWDHGEMTVNVGTIKGYGYGFYAQASNPARDTVENFWMTAHEIVSSGSAAIYTVGNTNNYRMWITAKEVKGIANPAIALFGDQRFYITAQKISTELSGGTTINLASNGKPEAWIVSEKITCVDGKFVWLASGQAGTLDITAQHYEATGTAGGAIGFLTAAGTNIIHGGRAKIGNGKGISHEGGRTFAENLYIDTATTTNTANNPVSVSAAGLILKDCILFAPAGAQCITAGSAQSVTILGTVMCNQTNSPNITFIGGGTLITNTAMIRL